MIQRKWHHDAKVFPFCQQTGLRWALVIRQRRRVSVLLVLSCFTYLIYRQFLRVVFLLYTHTHTHAHAYGFMFRGTGRLCIDIWYFYNYFFKYVYHMWILYWRLSCFNFFWICIGLRERLCKRRDEGYVSGTQRSRQLRRGRGCKERASSLPKLLDKWVSERSRVRFWLFLLLCVNFESIVFVLHYLLCLC